MFGPDVRVAVERRGERLEGPGISDNARGLAVLVSVAEAMVRARVNTARPILFVATVGEEGSGDLRGVKYLLNGKTTVGTDNIVGARHALPKDCMTHLYSSHWMAPAWTGSSIARSGHGATA